MLPIGNPLRYTLGSPEDVGRTLAVRSSPDGFLTAIWTEKQLHITREGVSLGHINLSGIVSRVESPFNTCSTILWKPITRKGSSALLSSAGLSSLPLSSPLRSYRLALVHETAVVIIDAGVGAMEGSEGRTSGGFFRWLLGDDDSEDDDELDEESPFRLPEESEEGEKPAPLPIKIRYMIAIAPGNAHFTCAAASPYYILLGRKDCILAAATWNGDFVYEAQLKPAEHPAATPTGHPDIHVHHIALPAISGETDCVVVTLSNGAIFSVHMRVAPALRALSEAGSSTAAKPSPTDIKSFAPFILQDSLAHIPVTDKYAAASLVVCSDIIAVSPSYPECPTYILACGRKDGSVSILLGYAARKPDAAADQAVKVIWYTAGSHQVAQRACKVQSVAWRINFPFSSVELTSSLSTAVLACFSGGNVDVIMLNAIRDVVGPTSVQGFRYQAQFLHRISAFDGGAHHASRHSILDSPTETAEALAIENSTAFRADISWGIGGQVLLGPIRHMQAQVGRSMLLLREETESESAEDSDNERRRVSRLPHMWTQPIAATLDACEMNTGGCPPEGEGVWLLGPTSLHSLRKLQESACAEISHSAVSWTGVPVSSHYIPSNLPIRCAAAAPNGGAVAVAGAYGAAIYFPGKRTWRVFPTRRQERTLIVRALAWLSSKILVVVTQKNPRQPEAASSPSTLRISCYPRSHLDLSMTLCDCDTGLPTNALVQGMASGLTIATVGPFERAGSGSKAGAAVVQWLVLAVVDGAVSKLLFYRVFYKGKDAAAKNMNVLRSSSTPTHAFSVSGEVAAHGAPPQDTSHFAYLFEPHEAVMAADVITEVKAVATRADGNVVIATEEVKRKGQSAIGMECCGVFHLPANVTGLCNVEIFNTRVHLMPSVGPATSGAAATSTADTWLQFLPRVLAQDRRGRAYILDPADQTMAPLPSTTASACASRVFTRSLSSAMPGALASLGYIANNNEVQVVFPRLRVVRSCEEAAAAATARGPHEASYALRRCITMLPLAEAEILGFVDPACTELALCLRHGRISTPPISTKQRRSYSLGPASLGSQVSVAADLIFTPWPRVMISALISLVMDATDGISSVVYRTLVSYSLYCRQTCANVFFASCCSILQEAVEGHSGEKPSTSTAGVPAANEKSARGLSPRSYAMLLKVAHALATYIRARKYTPEVLLSLQSEGSSTHRFDTSSQTSLPSDRMDIILHLLRDTDMLLDVVAAVGRTVEEDQLPALLPRAGQPRALFSESLRRAELAAKAAAGAPNHNAESLRYLRTAAAFMLLIQEYAWRIGSRAPRTIVGVVDIVNGNLADAASLLETIGIAKLPVTALVGTPLAVDGDAVRAEFSDVKLDPAALLSFVTDDENKSALVQIVENVVAYCARLRRAAVEQAAEISAKQPQKDQSWSLIGTVATLFGLGGPSAEEVEDAQRRLLENDVIFRVLRRAWLPLLDEDDCSLKRKPDGNFGLLFCDSTAVINEKNLAFPLDAVPVSESAKNPDVAALLDSLKGAAQEQLSWLAAQTVDAKACIVSISPHSECRNPPHVGDLIRTVEGRSSLGLGVDAVSTLLSSAPRETTIGVFRLVSRNLLDILLPHVIDALR